RAARPDRPGRRRSARQTLTPAGKPGAPCIPVARGGDESVRMRVHRMAADLSLELPQHAQAMRSLARLLVCSPDADGLLQDVALQVLAAAPPAGAWLPAWLRVVLRRRAGNMRRGDRRRAQREQVAAAARADDAVDPAQAAAHRETLARVTKALLELAD